MKSLVGQGAERRPQGEPGRKRTEHEPFSRCRQGLEGDRDGGKGRAKVQRSCRGAGASSAGRLQLGEAAERKRGGGGEGWRDHLESEALLRPLRKGRGAEGMESSERGILKGGTQKKKVRGGPGSSGVSWHTVGPQCGIPVNLLGPH